MEVTGQEARFRAMFAEEAEGRLAALSELLLELERNGEDQELLSSVFREAHTLKGAAAVVGLADVLWVAHAMEEVLEGLRRGVHPGTVDALLGAVDGMREMVPPSWPATTAPTAPTAWSPTSTIPARPGAAADPAPPPSPESRLATAGQPPPRRGRGLRLRVNGSTSWSGWWRRRASAAGQARGHRPAQRAGRHPRAARPQPHP